MKTKWHIPYHFCECTAQYNALADCTIYVSLTAWADICARSTQSAAQCTKRHSYKYYMDTQAFRSAWIPMNTVCSFAKFKQSQVA